MNDPIAFLDERFAMNEGPVQLLKMGPKPFALVFDPKLAVDILDARSGVFVQNRTIFDRIRPITGEKGLVQLNGAASVKGRKQFSPMFAASNMIKMKGIVAKNTSAALEDLQDGPLDISSFMADLVLRNAFQLFLGLDMKDDALTMANDFQELNALCGERMIAPLPLPLKIPTRKNRRIKELRKNLREKIAAAIKAAPQASNINIPQLFPFDEFMIDQCMTFLFAGHETTASSLTFTFLLLGKHPELREAIANGDDALALRVYKEALRLYPPAYMLAREANEDCELSGVKIKKGTQVIVGVKQLHYHPDIHTDPESFKPERFTRPVDGFIPFGIGPKACIGEGIAYMEALTIIKLFCVRFDFSTWQSKIKSYPLVTLHPAKNQMLQMRKR